ncbi:argininosuccinate synthetase [Phlyctochytrium bullatum]|nr:argininosuccinate synthetase [Phlyctochytrium bullatum]
MRQTSDIRNKQKREEVYHKIKAQKGQEKLKRRQKIKKDEEKNPELKRERLKENLPVTIDNSREGDETIVDDDDEILEAEETDEFADYFLGLPPKILITTSRRATPKTYDFVNEFITIFPDAQFVKRGPQFEIKKIVEIATKREFTDVIIVNESNKQPSNVVSSFSLSQLDAITVIHLPKGPTAYFKLSSVKLNREIQTALVEPRQGHARLGPEKPELILNNFNTRLGHTVGRMLAALFPQVPEFKGRQVATFHNQRDFIFFRRHRYIFRNGERCDLQEIGPRFTLKLKWLQKGTFDTKYGEYEWLFKCQGYEVVAYMANIGQEEDFEAARKKALAIGAVKVYIEDLRKEFVEDVVYPAAQANTLYEACHLYIEIAKLENCQFVSHGCTGKGNDQVRFELGYLALEPTIKIIAPWRIPEFYERFPGRSALLEYAALKKIPVVQTAAKPWSTDENLYHISYEAGILEDPSRVPPKDMWKLTADPEDAPNTPERIAIHFEGGKPTCVENLSDGATKKTDPLDLFLYLNALGRKHGIGRIDIVENRFVGIKSRGCYETPGGTILRAAHVDLEGLTLDREVRRLRDQFSQRLAEIIYNGFWFSPEREFIMAAVKESQLGVSGVVNLKLYKGNVIVEGRQSQFSLYDDKIASMDVAGGFNPSDSTGFIQITAIRLKAYVNQKRQITGSGF